MIFSQHEITFFGNSVSRLDISANNLFPSFLNWGGEISINPVVRTEYAIDVSFYITDKMNIFDSFKGGVFTISKIGDSHICKYCSAMVKAGCISCHRCGGDQTEVIPRSRYHKTARAKIDSLRTSMAFNSPPMVDLRLIIIGALHFDDNMRQNPSSIFNGWSTTHEQDGWICKYCNGVVKGETIDCPNCGSGRVPFSDLKKMRINCLYCGKPTNGNTVCRGCGATDNGYSMWQPRLDWN